MIVIRFIVILSLHTRVFAFQSLKHVTNCNRHYQSSSIAAETTSKPSLDLTGYTLWTVFDGFGQNNVPCIIKLLDNSKSDFSGGISSRQNGFWRIIDDTSIEITHPVKVEHMYFLDIWEPSILWRGKIVGNKIVDGEVLTNKKRFGIFPYKETLATFQSDIIPPGGAVPEVKFPQFTADTFRPPKDFETPYDMKKYPDRFSPEFIEWWFSVEDAMARGEEPPPRPKAFFSPEASGDGSSSDEIAEGGRVSKSKGSGFATKGKQ